MVGGALFTGFGVTTHDLSVAGATVQAFSGLTGHGSDVDVASSDAVGVKQVDRVLESYDISRYDAVIVSLDGLLLQRRGAAVRSIVDLFNSINARAPIESRIVLVMGNEVTKDAPMLEDVLADSLRGQGEVLRLSRALDSARWAYGVWGKELAQFLATRLQYPRLWVNPVDRVDERQRLKSVDFVQRLGIDWHRGFTRIVDFARLAYGARYASLQLVDGNAVTATVTSGGRVPLSERRSQSLADRVLQRFGGLIIGNCQEDEELRAMLHGSSSHIRFYAGHRINCPTGQPIAVLSVSDTECRPVLSQDIDLLRDFAHSAEKTLVRLCGQLQEPPRFGLKR